MVASWLKRFRAHQANGLAEIVNFVLRCAGCALEVNAYDIGDPDNASNRLIEIQEEFQVVRVVLSITHHWSLTNIIAKRRRSPFDREKQKCGHVQADIGRIFQLACQDIAATSVLYDNPEPTENINSWVGTTSSAPARPFRHTAAFISFAVMSALCEVARDVVINRAKSLRQEEGERKKKGKVNQERIKSLQNQGKGATRRKGFWMTTSKTGSAQSLYTVIVTLIRKYA